MNAFHQQVVIVIPARLGSTRLPRKMLLAETGKPLVIHTWEAAQQSTRASLVLIATDSAEIVEAARAYGAEVCLTSPNHLSGTDRVAEAVQLLMTKGFRPDIVVNLQGDEPEIPPAAIDHIVDLLTSDGHVDMATLASPIRSRDKFLDPATVKVILDARQRALYFSRSPIPYPRSNDGTLFQKDPPCYWQHIGIYAYRTQRLLEFTKLSQPDIEKIESLEQLRALWHGYAIKVGFVWQHNGGIDTAEDYAGFVARWRDKTTALLVPALMDTATSPVGS